MTKKTCFKCGKTKSLDDFYKHPRMADGHLGKCKECTRKDVAANYQAHRKQYAEYEQWRFKQTNRKLAVKQYRQKRRQHHPEKCVANSAVSYAVHSGRLHRQPCEVCGNPKSQGHHDDYGKPLNVRWLCRKHHLQVHGKIAYEYE
jgi:hypothetical protein